MFAYNGPATIDGINYPSVLLQEERSENGMGSWSGSISFPQAEVPEGFTGSLGGGDSDTIELPDGRTGQVLITNVNFDGHRWSVELLGTGTPPS